MRAEADHRFAVPKLGQVPRCWLEPELEPHPGRAGTTVIGTLVALCEQRSDRFAERTHVPTEEEVGEEPRGTGDQARWGLRADRAGDPRAWARRGEDQSEGLRHLL